MIMDSENEKMQDGQTAQEQGSGREGYQKEKLRILLF